MKNLLTLVLLLPIIVSAQKVVFPTDSVTNLVSYSFTAQVPETAQNILFNRAKNWFDQENKSGQLLSVQEREEAGLLSSKKNLIRKYSYNTTDTIPIAYQIEFTVRLIAQNNIYKIILTDYSTKTTILDITSVAPIEEVFSLNRQKKTRSTLPNKDEQETLRIRNDLAKFVDESSKDCISKLKTAMAQ
ncbi:hypothetical protein SAMN04488511_1127 [Pedobacter suwonensis]|uniref:DUF4468 domain-containing protein n=1 Tax=Pedobacter suwonensis TaxID=332999 RepID=A0A1I0TNF8_9SPHI|nr:hypothetical protein [Pedobacter suwonensis]SFA53254.1 hypothetical protein SAMN04488511_1127 [Pedobacter suwonensis]